MPYSAWPSANSGNSHCRKRVVLREIYSKLDSGTDSDSTGNAELETDLSGQQSSERRVSVAVLGPTYRIKMVNSKVKEQKLQSTFSARFRASEHGSVALGVI